MLAATMMTTGTAMVQVDSRGVGSKDSGIDTGGDHDDDNGLMMLKVTAMESAMVVVMGLGDGNGGGCNQGKG
jgi:hypothetical protein